MHITSKHILIPIIPSESKKGWDEYTIKKCSITSLQLMEEASNCFMHFFKKEDKINTSKIAILAGNGNNGGDGIAIARLLSYEGYAIHLFIDKQKSRRSEDNAQQLNKLPDNDSITLYHTDEFLPWITALDKEDSITIIDGIFGTGFKGNLSSPWRSIVQFLNTRNGNPIKVYAIDIPSGCNYDGHFSDLILRADCTICFENPALAAFLTSTGPTFGNIFCTSIGLLESFLTEIEVKYFLVSANYIQKIVSNRNRFTHKGSFGRAFIWGGSPAMPGAGLLNIMGAQYSGVGYVYHYAVELSLKHLILNQHPETICAEDFELIHVCDAIAIGSGIGISDQTKKVFLSVLRDIDKLLILDGDALTMIADTADPISYLSRDTLITPHPKEFDRLFGKHNSTLERLQTQRKISKETGCTILLKGAYSSISGEDGVIFFNPTGNDALARAGSGDVLTGLIAGLLAQGHTPLQSAIIGAYIHGLAAELAIEYTSSRSIPPTTVAQHIGRAFKIIETLTQ